MRIGFLPDSKDAADRLRERGYVVDEYNSDTPFDILLYSGEMSADPIAGINPIAPLFMLNTSMVDDDEIDRQINDRSYSRLFE
jgi:hypothetical protein